MTGEGADQLAAQPGVSAGDYALAQMIQSEEARRDNNKTAATFKDGMLKIEDIILEDNKVAVLSTHTATQAGPFMGPGSKGRPFTIMTSTFPSATTAAWSRPPGPWKTGWTACSRLGPSSRDCDLRSNDPHGPKRKHRAALFWRIALRVPSGHAPCSSCPDEIRHEPTHDDLQCGARRLRPCRSGFARWPGRTGG